MHNKKVWRMMFLMACILVLASSIYVAGQPAPFRNFVNDVMDHKSEIQWITYKTPTLPDDVCTILSACTGPAAKVAALPPATIHGRKVGRALFLTEVKKQQTIILEHQVRSEERRV